MKLTVPVGCVLATLSLPIAARAADEVVLNRGDDGRLDAVFARAERGERVVLGAFGGSITYGTGATKWPGGRWTDLVADWFVQNFPKATFVRANAGLGATGSLIGAHRISTDVAPHDPDFVTVDFSVNDGDSEPNVATMDSCARQLLALPKSPAVMFVSFMESTGRSVQDDHLVVARHYGLPHISVKNAVWPDIASGRRTWASWSADNVHPNDAGHAAAASLVTGFLADRLADWRRRGCPTPAPAAVLPAPLSTSFASGRMLAPAQMTVLENRGFVADGTERKGWGGVMVATQPGARFAFETTSPTVTLLHWCVHGDYGRARVTVDGIPLTVLEGWYEETWGGYVHSTIALRDCPGRHVVSIEVLPERNAASGGHRFELCKVLVAGEVREEAAADTFENYLVGTGIGYVPGWTGEGRVVAETPQVPDPPGYPVRDATHERVLTSAFGAARALDPVADGCERICDFLVKVRLHENPDWRDVASDLGGNRFALSFDCDGTLCLCCDDGAGRGRWARVDEAHAYAKDEWVRVRCRFRNRRGDGKTWVQLAVNGRICRTEAGSWFPLLETADGTSSVSSISFEGETFVDDFVAGKCAVGGLSVVVR